MEELSLITLLTDFKAKDGYIGIMKGVILYINPGCRIIDLAHEIPSRGILEAAFILGHSYQYFPKGSIHVVVVDPGVGSERRPIVMEADEHFFLGTDNGVFSFIHQKSKSFRVFELSRCEYFLPEVSDTFHGRDIFAPAAAHLSRGIPLQSLGNEITDFVRIDIPEPRIGKKEMGGEIIYIDGFGNLVTNLSKKLINDFTRGNIFHIIIGDKRLNRISRCYSEVPEGELIGIFGSAGYLEISVNWGNAELELNARRKDAIKIIAVPSEKR